MVALAKRLQGSEPFHSGDVALPTTVLDFWRWTGSDLLSNATRGRLAEFLVATGLSVAEGVRREWVAHDLTTADGTKVEVKSAAYVQGWEQRRPSPIVFDIRPTLGWDPDTAKFGDARRRQADVYVFALLHEKDTQQVDPLDLQHWSFFVLTTSVLDQVCPDQKTISLQRLVAVGAKNVPFAGLAEAVRSTPETQNAA